MKKIISMLLIVCLLGVLASGCGSNKQTVDSIKESGKLIIHTNAGFAPYEYPSNGKVVGVDMDIAKAIADKLGVELVIEDVKFDTIITSVQSGKAALGVAGITVTEERKESVDFSITYATSVQYIIVPAAAEVDTIEDLAGLKIGVQLGTTGNFIIDDEINGIDEEDGTHTKGVLEGTGAECVTYNNANLAAVAMESGKLGAVVIDKLPAEIIGQKYGEKFKVMELVYEDGSKTTEEYAIAIAKGNESLLEVVNEVLAELKNNGKIDEWVLYHSQNAVMDEE